MTAVAQNSPDDPPKPVDGRDLVDAISGTLRRYLVMPSDHVVMAVVLWIIHSWSFRAAEATPYMYVVSAVKQSGKTRLLEVIELLACDPWRIAGASEAVMFRKIEADTPTLIFDEVDAVFGVRAERTEPIRGVLNAGSRRGGVVSRCVGEHHEVKDFNVFCPKVMAGLATTRLPDTVRDRAVTLAMHRKKPNEQVERFRLKKATAEAAPIRTSLENWAEQNVEQLVDADPDLPEELPDRAADGWEPLLAIAEQIGPEMAAAARQAAVELSAAVEVSDLSIGERLLSDIRSWFATHADRDRVSSEDLCDWLRTIVDSPWQVYGRKRDQPGLTQRDLAHLLRMFGIKPRTVRMITTTAKGYKREWFTEAFERYVTPAPDGESTE